MKPIRNVLIASMLASGVLLTASRMSMATGADEPAATSPATTMPPPPPGPPGWHHHGWRHHDGREHLLAQLGLSAAQQQSVDAIMTAAQPQRQSLHEQMQANSLKLRHTQPSDPNYSNIVAQTSQTQGSLAAQGVTQREEIRAQVFKVLTPAQQTQLAALEAQRDGAE